MGKSTVAGLLRDLGVPVHDADATVHDLLSPGGEAVEAVARAFPEAAGSGGSGDFIDRTALGAIVFADPERKRELEKILHPRVRAAADRFVAEKTAQGCGMAALDIPLLFETGGENRVDLVLCVTAEPEIQAARVLARPGMTEEKFSRILAGQMPDAEKRRRADYIIDTSRGLKDTQQQLEDLLRTLSRKENAP